MIGPKLLLPKTKIIITFHQNRRLKYRPPRPNWPIISTEKPVSDMFRYNFSNLFICYIVSTQRFFVWNFFVQWATVSCKKVFYQKLSEFRIFRRFKLWRFTQNLTRPFNFCSNRPLSLEDFWTGYFWIDNFWPVFSVRLLFNWLFLTGYFWTG